MKRLLALVCRVVRPRFKKALVFLGVFALWMPQLSFGQDQNSLDLSDALVNYDWLDMGGEVRFRGEYRHDYDLQDSSHTPTDNDEFILGRLRLWAQIDTSEYIKAFIEVQSAWEWESQIINPDLPDIGGGNIYQDRIDIQQAYLDIYPRGASLPFYIRLGRQNLDYGKQRLIGSFQWANVARSFDAIRLRYDNKTWWADAYVAQVVVHDDNRLNDTDNDLPNFADDSVFYTIYGGYRGLDWVDLECYWIFRNNENASRRIHTLGSRFEGRQGPWDYDGELAVQFGDWANHVDHQALAVHLGGGYTFANVRATPRLGAQYNYGSGDDNPGDGEHHSFDNLFPTNHLHYGYIDFFSWSNMHNLQLEFKCDPVERLWIKTHLHFFWLAEEDDQWYNAGGGATAGVGSMSGRHADRYVGEELDIVANYIPDLPGIGRSLALQIGYSHFFGEDFVNDAIGDEDGADFAYLQMLIKF